MKKNVLNLTLLAGAIVATGTFVTACSGGDDDDDDDGGSQPVVLQADGGAADFTSCAAAGSGGNINVLVRVGEQGFDTSIPTADLPASVGANVVAFDPIAGTTSGGTTPTDAAGETTVTVQANEYNVLKMTHAPNGSATFVDTYNYALLAPAASDTAGDPVFSMRIIPTAVQNGIAAIIGVPTASLAGTMQFAGSVVDCAGESIVGVTLQYAGAEPNRCSGSATLPCVSYSTDTGEPYSDDSGQVFILGLAGSGQHTVNVMAVLTEGGTPTQVGSLTVRGVGGAIALGAIPAENAP